MKTKTHVSWLHLALIAGLLLGVTGNLWPIQPVRADPGVLYVAPTAQGSGNCSNWANACTLQYALTHAASGDEIWVKAGTYTPGSARTDSFRIQRNVQLYGGFVGTESSRDERDWVANPTILSGDIGTVGIKGDNAYHVVYVDGTTANGPITSATVIDGFTITAGNANGSWPDDIGGGLYCNGKDSGHACSPTLRNVTFSGNTATNSGGGMFNNGSYSGNSSPTLTNVTFSGNSAYYGGGMYNYGPYSGTSSPTLTNVTFSGNSATYGGGMYNYTNGGISSPTLTNVTFSGNSASRGGGMYNYGYNGTSSPTLSNCILWGNTASEGPQMHNASASPTVSYSDIQGGCPSGATCGDGMLYTDPKFVNAAGGNLRLQPASPAIDAGNNAAVPGGITTDLDGNSRFVDIPAVPDTGYGTPPIVDMGAYEAQYIDVALGKAVSPQPVAPGQAITFTLRLSNSGESIIAARGLVITDTLPSFLEGLSFTSTLVITDTGYTPPYVWQVQDLAPGQSGVITVSGMLTLPLAAGIYTNTAIVSAANELALANNTAIVTFTVPNVAPFFTSTPVTAATQDAPYTCTATAGDDNGDALTITAPTKPAWLMLTDNGDGTATLSGTPSNADVGEHAVLLQVTDSGGLSDTQAFTITVANVNDAPSFTSTPVTTATQDILYTYAVATTDPDLAYGDALTITAPTLPAWLTLDWMPGAITATLSGTPSQADVGEHAVLLRVTDSGGLSEAQAFTVTVANVNEVPSFTSTPVTTAIQGVLYTYAITTTDPDLAYGDVLTITAPTLPAWLTLEDHGNGTASLSGTPSNADVGEHAVVLRVTDSGGLTGTQAFTVTVANVNDAPSFTSAPVTTATQDILYIYAVATTDPDLAYGDALTITAPTRPAWLTLTDNGDGTATLAGTPDTPGAYPVVLQVTDRFGASAEQSFTITVSERPQRYIFLPLVLRNKP